jgi:endonuclease/exonuclease/phosphatase family metal-dependent hydrolase
MRFPLLLLGLTAVAGCAARVDVPAVLVPTSVRVATFNIFELGTAKLDARDSTGSPTNAQALAAAAIIQAVRPDILLLNEIDALPGDPALAARRFASEFLAAGPDSIVYPYIHSAPTNTGELSGFDLNHDGVVATAADSGTRAHGDDSWGYGTYHGQYGMAILSRYPIDTATIRTFRLFLWKDLPNAHLPEGWYSDAILAQFRLSSKAHWDVPVLVGRDTLHLFASHPTPPVFDGDEDRNGRRNYDEVGFWTHYLDNSPDIRDDRGRFGGRASASSFVILGDLNAPPDQVESHYGDGPAIMQLLNDPRIQDPPQISGHATAFFRQGVRADYVLPAAGLRVLDGGVVWPDSTTDAAGAARAAVASDHRLVWIDLGVPFRRP